MTPLTSTDPSDIANAARCFASCIGDQLAVRTYLLSQVADISTPPCVTPTAPSSVQVTTSRVSDPTTQLNVRWVQASNSGSLITGYEVFWGTTMGGPYTSNSGLLPVSPKTYTITGLTSGTTYYVVVQAFTSISGCVSANSSEATGTTTGGGGQNTVQNGLIDWWKLDEAQGAARADSVGGITLSEGANLVASQVGVIINWARFTLGQAGLQAASASNLQFGAGVSKTFALWFATTTLSTNQVILSKWNDGGSDREYTLSTFGGTLTFTVRNLANGANVSVNSSVSVTTNFVRYVAFGFDNTNQVIWIRCEGETRQTTACTGVRSSSVQFRVGSSVDTSPGGNFGLDGVVDELGIWNRVLTDSEVDQVGATFSVGGILSGVSSGTDNANRWAAQVVTNGGAAPSANTKLIFAAFVDGCITDGTYYQIDHWNGIVNDSLIAAITPWYRSPGGNQPWTNHNFVAGDLTINGLTGNGTNKYLDTGVVPNNFFANSIGLSLYVYNNVNEAKLDFGCQNNAAVQTLELYSPRAGDGGFFAAWNETGGLVTGTLPNLFQGFISGSRTTTTAAAMYYASSVQAFSAGGTAATNGGTNASLSQTIYLFNEFVSSSGGPFATGYSSKTHSFMIVHFGMSSAQTQAVYNRVQAFRVAIGGGFR